jgi:long-chain acyl-CoA synthetase
MNLVQAFVDTATTLPEQEAVFWGSDVVRYGELLAHARAISHVLRTCHGIQPGDRVGLYLKNRPEFITALFGIFSAGAVAVPINSFLKPDEVRHVVSDAGIRIVLSEEALSEEALSETLSAVQADATALAAWNVESIGELPPSPDEPVVPRETSDLAVLLYTSGTTGKPKGAMLTHGNLAHNVESLRQVLLVAEVDRFVLLLPMFHTFMLTVCVLLPLRTGGSIVLVRSVSPAKAMIHEIIANKGSVLPAMAALFRALSQLPAEVQLPLRLCISGAGPLPGEILRAFSERFPELPLIEGYGLTETSPVATVNPVKGRVKAGSIGLPISDVEVSVQDESGQLLPDDVEGEICVRGGNVMAGYWNQPEATAATMRGDWLLTGDIGKRDADGYFFITDRKKDMLKPNGMNVYPREIEEVIYRFNGIKEAAVIGEPDERRGERALAFVSLDEGVQFNERALIDFLKEHLADYKVPRRVVVLPALPRNATGKVLKTALRELAAKA